ncbi:hypothetical protein OF83DRAFT_1230371 [Amylostereum chailletii]|nr:hypothetical protein OF83DRAFT_1230371 [Amylostereum chailletii]
MSSANVSSSPAGHSPASLPPASASSATDDNRPRGGTARTPGTRTPRRVQWAPAVDDDEGQRFRDRQRGGSRTDSVDVPHLLDEAGLDPAAFETLADALEKHRSTSASPSPFPSAPPPTANLSKPPTISFPPSSFPHFPNTLSQAPPLREKDYFHPHPETPPTEPSSPPTFRSNRLSLPGELPREHDFPGEIFVDPNETAGLPVPKLTEGEDETDGMDEDTSAAKAIVHAHTRKSRLMASLPKLRLPTPPHARSKPSPPSASKSAPNMSRSRPRDRDVEHAAAHARSQLPAGLGAGGGILSALLALYDHQDDDPQSGASSRNPSPRRRGRGGRSRSSERRGGITPSGSPESGRGLSSALGRAFSGWKDARPAKERSAAGVWGPLIASTANISGAAAPVNSTIVPNIKRPGYHLSRYSLDEDLPRKKPSLARTRSANSDTLSPSATPGGLHLDLSSLPSPHLNLTMPHFPGREHTPEEASSTPASLARAPSPATSDASHFPFHAHSRSVSAADTLTPGGGGGGAVYRAKWSEVLKDLPKRGWNGLSSLPGTPGTLGTLGTETGTEEDWDEKDIRRWEKNDRDEKRRARQKRRKKAEIFITRHISSLIARQTFILKLARAMMMFGGPTHRLQAQLQSTTCVLEISLSCMFPRTHCSSRSTTISRAPAAAPSS